MRTKTFGEFLSFTVNIRPVGIHTPGVFVTLSALTHLTVAGAPDIRVQH